MNIYDFYITPDEYDMAAAIGVDRETLSRRVRFLGWEKQRAITTPKRKVTDRKKWREIAEQNGIPYSVFASRVNTYGWEEERAATEPLQDRRANTAKATKAIRKIPEDILRLAEANGIAYHTMRARIRKGWPAEQAATLKIMSKSEAGTIAARVTRYRHGDIQRVWLSKGRKITTQKGG